MEEKSAIELFKLNTENFLTEIITNLAANYDRLFAFCFELRKQDSNNNYSEEGRRKNDEFYRGPENDEDVVMEKYKKTNYIAN